MIRLHVRGAAIATLCAAAAPATVEPFTLFIYETADDLALRTGIGSETVAYWEGYGAFAAAAAQSGVLQGGSPLHVDPETIATLTGAGTADGPFANAALALGGHFSIDVADRASAMDWASRLPAAARGAVEVRAGYPAPAM